MKKWNAPEVVELDITETASGNTKNKIECANPDAHTQATGHYKVDGANGVCGDKHEKLS